MLLLLFLLLILDKRHWHFLVIYLTLIFLPPFLLPHVIVSLKQHTTTIYLTRLSFLLFFCWFQFIIMQIIVYPLLVDCSYLTLYTHAMTTPFVLYLISQNCTPFSLPHWTIAHCCLCFHLQEASFSLNFLLYTFAMVTFFNKDWKIKMVVHPL